MLSLVHKILLSVVVLASLSFSANAVVELNEIGPFDLSPQAKPHFFGFDRQNPEANKFYIELIQGDGDNIVLEVCRGKRSFPRFFCRVRNLYKHYVLRRNRVKSVKVILNGVKIVRKKEFNWKIGTLVKEISLQQTNAIKLN